MAKPYGIDIRETGYLIECQYQSPGGVAWLEAKNSHFRWTTRDVNALRFSRKRDAESLLAVVHGIMLGQPRVDQLEGFRVGDLKPLVIGHGWDYDSANSNGS